MTKKGIYPYEYMDDVKRCDETQLPPKESFYSTLTEECIKDDEYEHAQNVWQKFEVENLKQYHALYLMTDTLLLADVFEQFRDMCLKNYELDPVHSYTAPGLTWKAALKMTKVKLNLLTDIDQHIFIEDRIRGGVAMISQR